MEMPTSQYSSINLPLFRQIKDFKESKPSLFSIDEIENGESINKRVNIFI
jgi:hypothetical protein